MNPSMENQLLQWNGCCANFRLNLPRQPGGRYLSGRVYWQGQKLCLIVEDSLQATLPRQAAGTLTVFAPGGVVNRKGVALHQGENRLEIVLSSALATPERRAYPRLAIELPATLEVLGMGNRQQYPALVLNISAGGARIQTAVPLVEGELVRLHLSGGSGEFFTLTAAIRSVQTGSFRRAGLQWMRLGLQDKEQLRELLVSLVARGRAPGRPSTAKEAAQDPGGKSPQESEQTPTPGPLPIKE